MSKLFSKHLHLCFFKLKYPTIPQSPPHPENHHHTQSPPPSSTFHFKSSFKHNHNHKGDSLNDGASSSAHSTFKSTDEDLFSSSSDSDTWELPPDLPSVISSQRFFFTSPGRSNSIIEYTRPSNSYDSNSNSTKSKTLIPKGGVGVTKHSVDPYVDFRRSMQEMIDSRELVDVRKDWDYLHELLLCYLALNHPRTHRYIVRAFTDLVVDLLSSSPSSELKASHCRKPMNRRQRSFSGPLV